jgi:ankyrin repeat protein
VDQLTGPGGGGPQGADVGSTALHLAAGAGHLPVVKMLVSPTKTEDSSQIVENIKNTLLCFSYVLAQRQAIYFT